VSVRAHVHERAFDPGKAVSMVATKATRRTRRGQHLKDDVAAAPLNVGGQLEFARSVYAEIAARVLRDIREVRQTAADAMTGFLGRLLARGAMHPGVQVEEREGSVVFHLDVVAKHGANFYDLGLEIQRRVSERVRHMTGHGSVVNVSVRGIAL
jgi:uncharacterized alkaline shock family protein YloU